MRRQMRLIPAIIVLGLLAYPPTTHAESTPAQEATPNIPKPLKVMPVKIKPVQTSTDELSKAAPDSQGSTTHTDTTHLETLNPRGTYGFPSDFWENSTRKDLVNFLSPKDITSPNAVTHDLLLRATLTPAPNLANTDSANENIYALRIQRLVDLGNFQDAMTLYKLNEDAPPTPLAARAGIEAILGHGEMAVACLEQKALDKSLKTDTPQIWLNIDTLCQALLSPVAGTDDTLRLSNAARIYADANKLTKSITATEFNTTDIVSAIAMIKTNRIAGILTNQSSLTSLTDKKISLLLAYLDKTSPIKLPVLAVAIKRGLLSGDAAIAEIVKIEIADKTNPYANFLTEYKLQTPALIPVRLLELADTAEKQNLLIPLYAVTEPKFPNFNLRLSIKLLLAANHQIAPNLVKNAFLDPQAPQTTPENTPESGENALISHLISSLAKTDTDRHSKLLTLKVAFDPQNVNKNAYDNILNLTASGNYVMPNAEILSSLKKSAEQKQIDQVVVTSLKILMDTPTEKLHPAALYQIFEAFNSAGLTEETLSLARSALGTLFKE